MYIATYTNVGVSLTNEISIRWKWFIPFPITLQTPERSKVLNPKRNGDYYTVGLFFYKYFKRVENVRTVCLCRYRVYYLCHPRFTVDDNRHLLSHFIWRWTRCKSDHRPSRFVLDLHNVSDVRTLSFRTISFFLNYFFCV